MNCAALRFKPRRKIAAHRLPFVGRQHRNQDDIRISYWDVPLTGGYTGGNQTGMALAKLLLAHMRENHADEMVGYAAGAMMLSMLEAARTADDDQFEALRGQALGVMDQLTPFLVDAAYHAGRELDGLDAQKVLALANAGLAFEEHAYIASLTTEE